MHIESMSINHCRHIQYEHHSCTVT